MRRFSLVIVMSAVAGAAWLSVMSEERAGSAKPQAGVGSRSKQAESGKDETTRDDRSADEDVEEPVKAIVSGKVMALGEALKQRGIKSYAEEVKGQVVLVTRTGEIVPIVPDWRGRAFYQDERLRNRPVDLVVNRRKGVPWVQVLSIYTFDEKGVRNITDYWCDICSIPMYEIKDCECCQGPTRLRLRPQELPEDLARPDASVGEKSKTVKDN
jgi:hypothetical protein